MSTTSTQTQPTTVRFARRSSRGVLLGFTGPQLVAIGIALAVAMFGLVVLGGAWIVNLSPFWIGLVVLTFYPARGRPAVEAVPVTVDYHLRKATGQTTFKVRPEKPRPAGTMALPGDGASLRYYEDPANGAVYVHDHHGSTLTAVAHVSHAAAALKTAAEQWANHSGIGTLLATMATTGNCARVQLLEQARPNSGNGIKEWFADKAVDDAPPWARREYATVIQDRATSGAAHDTFIAVSLDMDSASRAIKAAGKGMVGAAAVIRQDMVALESGLNTCGLRLVSWLDAPAMAGIVRAAYDPAGAALADGTPLGKNLATAGPVYVREHPDYIEHDGSFSATLWISEWPRSESVFSFLAPIIFSPGISHTTSITITPMGQVDAMKTVRTEKTNQHADLITDAKWQRTPSEAATQERADTVDRERALMVGHADTRFTGLITTTAPTKDLLDTAVSQLQRAATRSGCETRPLYGQQAQAFLAGALPLARKVN